MRRAVSSVAWASVFTTSMSLIEAIENANADAAKVKGPPCRRCALKGRCRGADGHYIASFGWAGFRPVKRPGAAAAPAPSGGRYPSANEKCLGEIPRQKDGASTKEVLAASKKIVLCRDCSDGNAVMTAAASLAAKGVVKSSFAGGVYRWSLLKPPAEIRKLL